MRRLGMLFGAIALMATVAFSISSVAAQDDAVTTSNHAVIGAWMVQSHLEGGATGPNLTSFLPGGVVITANNPVFPPTEAGGSPQVRSMAQGNWVVVDEKTVDFTFFVLFTDPEGAGAGTRQINARFILDDTGNAMTGQYTAIVTLADGTVTTSRGAAEGTRIEVEQIDLSATPVAF